MGGFEHVQPPAQWLAGRHITCSIVGVHRRLLEKRTENRVASRNRAAWLIEREDGISLKERGGGGPYWFKREGLHGATQ
jgi:hypothetical protein